MMATILVADDDPHIRELVRSTLEREGHRVVEARDGQEAADALSREPVQLAVIDVMMPEVDGFELTRWLREERDVPILLLTALGEISHKVRGLRLGADDYLVKPFAPEELVARIEALLRRYRIRADGVLGLAGLRLLSDTYEVEANGEHVALQPESSNFCSGWPRRWAGPSRATNSSKRSKRIRRAASRAMGSALPSPSALWRCTAGASPWRASLGWGRHSRCASRILEVEDEGGHSISVSSIGRALEGMR